jgi:hypothetical protein
MRGYDPFNDRMNDPLIHHDQGQINTPQEPLEVKDQHIVALASQNGFLIGRNSVLEMENGRLKDKIDRLERKHEELAERNLMLENEAAGARAGYKSGSQLVDEIEEALKAKKGTTK